MVDDRIPCCRHCDHCSLDVDVRQRTLQMDIPEFSVLRDYDYYVLRPFDRDNSVGSPLSFEFRERPTTIL